MTMDVRPTSSTRWLLGPAAIGAVGAIASVYLPIDIGAIGTPFPVLIGAGVVAGIVGRGWVGLAAVLAGAFVGMVLALAAWALLGLPEAEDVPLAAAIMTVAIPIAIGGGYLVVRGVAGAVERRR